MSALLTVILLLFLAGLVVLNVFHGRKRGMIRSGIAIGVLLVSVVVAVFVSRAIASAVSEAILGMVLQSEDLATLFADLPSLEPILYATVSMLLAVAIFFVVYYVIRGILNLIALIVFHVTKLFVKSERDDTDKLVGMLLGGLHGVLIFCVFCMPLVGYLTLANNATAALLENGGEEANELVGEEVDLYQIQGTVAEYAKSPMVVATGVVSNNLLFNPLTTYTIDGHRAVLMKETTSLCRVAGGVMAVSNILTDTANGGTVEITDTQMQVMDTLADDFGDSSILCKLGSEFLSGASNAWLKGESFIGIDKPQTNEMLSPTVDAVLSIFATSDMNNIEEDLRTVLHVLSSLAESQVLSQMDQFDQLLQTLSDSGVVEEIIKTLGTNERMAPLVSEISNLGIRALASVLGIPADASEQYDNLMTELSDSVTQVLTLPEEERVEALADMASEKLDAYGVDVPEDIAETVAEAMLADMSEGEITPERMQEFFKVYAASSAIEEYAAPQSETRANPSANLVFLASNQKGLQVGEDGSVTLPDGTRLHYYTYTTLVNSGAYGLREHETGDLGTLGDASTMISCIITVQDILCGGGINADNAEQEAAFFQQIVNEAAKIAQLIANDAETEEIIGAVGGLMDALSSSEVIGEDATAGVMTAILQSDVVTSGIGITKREAADLSQSIRESAQEEDGSYTATMTTVSKALSVVKAVNDEEMTDAEREARIMELMDHLTPASASALEKMATPSLLKSQGVPAKSADASAEMAGKLFHNLAAYAKDHDDYDREATAVNLLFHIALSSKDNKQGYAFNDEEGQRTGRTGKTAYELVTIITESTVVSGTIDDVVYKDGVAEKDPFDVGKTFNSADRQELTEAMQKYYSEHPTDEVKYRLNGLAAIVNMETVLN